MVGTVAFQMRSSFEEDTADPNHARMSTRQLGFDESGLERIRQRKAIAIRLLQFWKMLDLLDLIFGNKPYVVLILESRHTYLNMREIMTGDMILYEVKCCA